MLVYFLTPLASGAAPLQHPLKSWGFTLQDKHLFSFGPEVWKCLSYLYGALTARGWPGTSPVVRCSTSQEAGTFSFRHHTGGQSSSPGSFLSSGPVSGYSLSPLLPVCVSLVLGKSSLTFSFMPTMNCTLFVVKQLN